MDNPSRAYVIFVSLLVLLFGWMVSLFLEPLYCHSSDLIETLAYRRKGDVKVVAECSLPERMGFRDHSLEARQVSESARTLEFLNSMSVKFFNLTKARVLIDFDKEKNFLIEKSLIVLGSKYLEHPADVQRAILFKVFFPEISELDFERALLVETTLRIAARDLQPRPGENSDLFALNSCQRLPFIEFNTSFCSKKSEGDRVSGPWQFFSLFAAKLVEPLESSIDMSRKVQFLNRLSKWREEIGKEPSGFDFSKIENWEQALVQLSQLRSQLWSFSANKKSSNRIRVFEVEDLQSALSILRKMGNAEVPSVLVFPSGEYSESSISGSGMRISKWITFSCSTPSEDRERMPSTKIHEWIWINACDRDSEQDLKKLANGLMKVEFSIIDRFEYFKFHTQSLVLWISESKRNRLGKLALGDRETWWNLGLRSQTPISNFKSYAVESVRKPLLSFRSAKLNQALTDLLSEGSTNY